MVSGNGGGGSGMLTAASYTLYHRHKREAQREAHTSPSWTCQHGHTSDACMTATVNSLSYKTVFLPALAAQYVSRSRGSGTCFTR